MKPAHEFTPAIMALEDAAGELIERARALALGANLLRQEAGMPPAAGAAIDGLDGDALSASPSPLPDPSNGEQTLAVRRIGKRKEGGKAKKPAREPRKTQDKAQDEASEERANTAPAPGTLKSRILAALAGIGRPASVAEVLAAAGGVKESVRMTLKRLVAAGEIEASGATRRRRYWVGGGAQKGQARVLAEAPPLPFEEIGRADTAAKWLTTRGWNVERAGADWRLDGKQMSTLDMLAKANGEREILGMKPYRLRGTA